MAASLGAWPEVRRGTGTVEADYLNGEIVLLGGCTVSQRPATRCCAGSPCRRRQDRHLR